MYFRGSWWKAEEIKLWIFGSCRGFLNALFCLFLLFPIPGSTLRSFDRGYSDVALSPIRNFAHKNTHYFWNGVVPDDEIRKEIFDGLILVD